MAGSVDPAVRGRFAALDGARGVAALLVVVFHARPFFGEAVPGGYLAVDLFFVLSGFVIEHAYGARLRAGMNLRSFARVRAIRLYPLYLAGLVVGALGTVAVGAQGLIEPLAPGFLALLMLAGAILLPSFRGGELFPLNIPSWSLFYEALANLLYAMLTSRLTSRAAAAAAVACFAGLGAFVVERGDANFGSAAEDALPAFLRTAFSFLVGVLLCRAPRAPALSPVAVLAVVALAVCAPVPQPARPLFDLAAVGLVFPAAIWLLAGAQPGAAGPVLRFLGRISYAVYALHWGLLWLAVAATMALGLPPLVAGMAFMAVLVGVAHLADRYADAPIRALLAGRWAGSPPLRVRLPGGW